MTRLFLFIALLMWVMRNERERAKKKLCCDNRKGNCNFVIRRAYICTEHFDELGRPNSRHMYKIQLRLVVYDASSNRMRRNLSDRNDLIAHWARMNQSWMNTVAVTEFVLLSKRKQLFVKSKKNPEKSSSTENTAQQELKAVDWPIWISF